MLYAIMKVLYYYESLNNTYDSIPCDVDTLIIPCGNALNARNLFIVTD